MTQSRKLWIAALVGLLLVAAIWIGVSRRGANETSSLDDSLFATATPASNAPQGTSAPITQESASPSPSPEESLYPTPTPTISAEPTETPTATATATSQATATSTAKSTATAKPKAPSATATPVPEPDGVLITIDRSSTMCGNDDLMIISGSQSALYTAGASYTAYILPKTSSSLRIPAVSTPTAIYVALTDGTTCLAGPQTVASTSISVSAGTTAENFSFIDRYPTSDYELSERLRRSKRLSEYTSYNTYMLTRLSVVPMQAVSAETEYLQKITAFDTAYSAAYPNYDF